MITYIFRRMLYAIPILIGVNLLAFCLFFVVNSPDDLARMHLGQKYITQVEVDRWKVEHGYDKPLFYNDKFVDLRTMTQTLFYQKSLRLFTFHFGGSDAGRDISQDIKSRMWPSLSIAVPVLFLGLMLNIICALGLIFFRFTKIDLIGVMTCVVLISISGLFYIIGGQYLIGKTWRLVPISGYAPGLEAIKFIILPIMVGIFSGLGVGTRWYRTIFLEEMNKDYVRTARAKGLSEGTILFKHILKNGMIPILTGVVAVIPLLFMGSLLLESFFGIPGLGSYTIDAIQQQDFAIVRAMVFLGTVFYIFGLILTDVSYVIVDPRIRLR